jgi:hypothetical protein
VKDHNSEDCEMCQRDLFIVIQSNLVISEQKIKAFYSDITRIPI